MQVTNANVLWGVMNVVLSSVLGVFLLRWNAAPTSRNVDSYVDDVEEAPPSRLVSSVWCRGESRRTRLCHFKNLCYNPKIKEYLFFHGPDTQISGLPARDNLSDYYIADLTSVEELNVHYMSVTDVPSDAASPSDVQFHPGVALLAKRFKPDNLMHVIHDDLLPLFATLQEYCAGVDQTCFQSVQLVLLDDLEEHRFMQLYRLLGNRHVLLSRDLPPGTVHCFREALVGLNKGTTWYEYGYRAPQRPVQRPASGQTIARFVRYFLGKLGLRHAGCDRSEKSPYAVLVSRTRNRLVLNELRVTRAVVEETSLKVVKMTDLGGDSIEETLSLVCCADMLIGMHGAALILAVFMRPGRALLEMFPYAVPSLDYAPYRTLANIPGVDLLYAAWENVFLENTRTHPERSPELGGLGHLPEWERRRISNAEQVTKHLCCNDPEWLFRIYQDTIVDERSFRLVLSKVHRMGTMRPKPTSLSVPDLHPGPVRNAACGLRSEKEYSVSWQAPWNLQFLSSGGDSHYEIWIRRVGRVDIRSVVTRSTRYAIPLLEAGVKYDCWIRCSVKNKVGNRQWVTCQ